MAELEVDLAGLRAIYRRDLPDAVTKVNDVRRDGERRIRDAYAHGITVATLTELTGLTPQRIYQVLNAPTVEDGNDDDTSRGPDPDE